MHAEGKAAAVAVVIASIGCMTALRPSLADPQPRCPDVAGINYARDPEDSHAYYLCVDGLERHHFRCPQFTFLVMAIPPKCVPLPHGMP